MGILAAVMLMKAAVGVRLSELEESMAMDLSDEKERMPARLVEEAESQAEHLKLSGLVTEALWPRHGDAGHRCYKLGVTDNNKTEVDDQSSCQDIAASAGHKYYAYQDTKKKCETYESCASTFETNNVQWAIYGCPAGSGWVNSECQAFEGDCTNGELIALESRTQDNHCGSCDGGYVLVNKQCQEAQAAYYVYGEVGSDECPDGAFRITTEAQCQQAAEDQGTTVMAAGEFARTPWGCFTSQSLSLFYFNTNPDGVANDVGMQVPILSFARMLACKVLASPTETGE